jgi:hypothetical protein
MRSSGLVYLVGNTEEAKPSPPLWCTNCVYVHVHSETLNSTRPIVTRGLSLSLLFAPRSGLMGFTFFDPHEKTLTYTVHVTYMQPRTHNTPPQRPAHTNYSSYRGEDHFSSRSLYFWRTAFSENWVLCGKESVFLTAGGCGQPLPQRLGQEIFSRAGGVFDRAALCDPASMITTYPDRVPTFVLAREIQAPLRRLAIRRFFLERVENTAVLQAAIRRFQLSRREYENENEPTEEDMTGLVPRAGTEA